MCTLLSGAISVGLHQDYLDYLDEYLYCKLDSAGMQILMDIYI